MKDKDEDRPVVEVSECKALDLGYLPIFLHFKIECYSLKLSLHVGESIRLITLRRRC